MTKTLIAGLFAAALLAAGSVAAQSGGHAGHHAAPAAGTEMADGEVRKVDKEAGRVTLKHGPLKALDMPAMTMVFRVKDKALLDKVQAGDKVRFKATNDDGKLTVTEIEPAS